MTVTEAEAVNVVAGLVYRQGLLLVCQRHVNSAFPLKWEFPGGKVEEGELDLHALRRELMEELGIDVVESTPIFNHTHVYPSGPVVRLKFFLVHRFQGEVINRAFQQISWVGVGELAQLDFLAGDLPLIKKLLSPDGERLLVRCCS